MSTLVISRSNSIRMVELYLYGHRHWAHDRRHRGGLEHPSSRDRGLPGFEIEDHGLDHDDHSHARGGRLFAGNSRLGCGEGGMEFVHGGESAPYGHLNAGHGQNQNARMLKVAYGPTKRLSALREFRKRGG